MVSDLFKGARYPLSAIGFFFKHLSLTRFILIPLAINTAVFTAGFVFFISKLDTLLSFLPRSQGWYYGVVYYLLAFILGLSFLTLSFYAFTIIGNLIAAPFNSALSEKVEELYVGRDQLTSGPISIFRDAWRSVATELKRFFLFALFFIPIVLINFIPFIGQIVFFILMLTYTCWALAFTFMDYALERRGLAFNQKVRIVLSRKSLSMGFGLLCFLMALIPFLNLFLIPICVTGGTLMFLREYNSTN